MIGEALAGGSPARRPGSDDGPCLQCAWPCRHSLFVSQLFETLDSLDFRIRFHYSNITIVISL